jgi:RimJ/RimL family protein N-acetyltransferase
MSFQSSIALFDGRIRSRCPAAGTHPSKASATLTGTLMQKTPEPWWMREATAVARMLMEHAFTFAGVERIIAHTTEANPASIAVLLRCGFHRARAGRETMR